MKMTNKLNTSTSFPLFYSTPNSTDCQQLLLSISELNYKYCLFLFVFFFSCSLINVLSKDNQQTTSLSMSILPKSICETRTSYSSHQNSYRRKATRMQLLSKTIFKNRWTQSTPSDTCQTRSLLCRFIF